MPRGPKPQYARIRIELINQHIGRCEAKQDYTAVAALKYFARCANIEISEKQIAEYKALYTAELARFN